MTMKTNNAPITNKTNWFTGEEEKVALSEILGVVGGIVGGIAVYAETGHLTSGIAGAAVGALGGYGMGNFVAPVCIHTGTGGKILTSVLSASFGVSCAALGGSLAEAFQGFMGDSEG